MASTSPAPGARRSLDWDDLRYFLAVARHGTLSAAARALAVTQPTVGRRVDAFERQLGARLFERRPSGYRLTTAGDHMRVHVERMESEAVAAERVVAGRDAGLHGQVRITTSEWLAVRLIGPALAPLLQHQPGLSIELLADARHLSLPKGEADLALRPSKFTHDAIFERRVAQLEFAFYASESYLARRGPPDFAAHCEGHSVILMKEDVGDVARPWLAAHTSRAQVATRTNGREPMAAMAAAGMGVACLPTLVGDGFPGLRRLRPAPALPSPSLWLGVHRDARSIPRVRAVMAFLGNALTAPRGAARASPRASCRSTGETRDRTP